MNIKYMNMALKQAQKACSIGEIPVGAVIVMNPKNGEILAYAVAPTYDPNKFQKVPNHIIKNWICQPIQEKN